MVSWLDYKNTHTELRERGVERHMEINSGGKREIETSSFLSEYHFQKIIDEHGQRKRENEGKIQLH